MKWPLGETHVAAGASLPSPPPRGPRNCLRHMERTAFGEADAAAGLGRWVPAGAERGRFPIIFNCQTLSQLRLPPRAGAPPGTAPPGTAPPATAPPGTAPPDTALAVTAPPGTAPPGTPHLAHPVQAPGPHRPCPVWPRSCTVRCRGPRRAHADPAGHGLPHSGVRATCTRYNQKCLRSAGVCRWQLVTSAVSCCRCRRCSRDPLAPRRGASGCANVSPVTRAPLRILLEATPGGESLLPARRPSPGIAPDSRTL